MCAVEKRRTTRPPPSSSRDIRRRTPRVAVTRPSRSRPDSRWRRSSVAERSIRCASTHERKNEYASDAPVTCWWSASGARRRSSMLVSGSIFSSLSSSSDRRVALPQKTMTAGRGASSAASIRIAVCTRSACSSVSWSRTGCFERITHASVGGAATAVAEGGGEAACCGGGRRRWWRRRRRLRGGLRRALALHEGRQPRPLLLLPPSRLDGAEQVLQRAHLGLLLHRRGLRGAVVAGRSFAERVRARARRRG